MPNTPEETRAHRAAHQRTRLHNNPEYRERQRALGRQYYWKNKDKRNAYTKAYRAKPENKARRIEYDRKKRAAPEYKAKMREYHKRKNRSQRAFLAGRPQPDVCDVCGRPENHKDGVVFDHCHQKGHFRGWLCRNCNWTLGLVEDDPSILLKLISYLKRTSNGSSPQLILPGI